MTVPANSGTFVSSIANGVTTVFPYPFYIIDAADLEVVVDGVVQVAGYTVSGEGVLGGGNIAFLVAPANGAVVSAELKPIIKRDTNYQQFGDWESDTVNEDFDKIWLAMQAVDGRQERSLHASSSAIAAGFDPELPPPEGGTALGYAADGKSFLNIILSTGTSLASLAASTGALLVGWIQAGVGAILRSISDKLRERLSPEDFGCVGDGATDDYTNMVKAITAAALAHAVLEFGSGKTYRITNTLNVLADYVLIDMNGATLLLDDATGLKSHIKFGDGGTTQYNVQRVWGKGIFTRQQTATAGAAIEADHVGLLEVNDVRVYGNSKIFRGVKLKRVIFGKVKNNRIEHTVSNGVYAEGTGSGADETNQIEIYGNAIEYTGANGIETFDFCEGFYIHDNIIYQFVGSGITLSASSNANGLISFKVQNNDLDTGTGKGVYIQNVSNVKVNNNWFSNNTGVNLHIDSTVVAAVVTGNDFYGTNGVKNLQIAGDDTVIVGNYVSGGQDGVYFEAAADTSELCSNVIKNAQAYGINVLNAPTNVSIGPNVMGSNATADVSSGTLATTITAADPLPLTGTLGVFNISGNTSFGGISGGWAGREVTLIFSGTPTVFHSLGGVTTAALSGGSHFVAAANNSLTLIHNGTRWYEKGRKV